VSISASGTLTRTGYASFALTVIPVVVRTFPMHHGLVIDQRSAAPVLGDVAEEAVLDLVPFGRRKVRDADREASAIREIKHGTNNAPLSLAG
jgi:hypothetical protein